MQKLLISLAISAVAAVMLSIGMIPGFVILRCERWSVSLASGRSLLFVLIPATSLILNATVAIRNGIPVPRVQDEFSYLLAGDTFSHGRLTNPTPKFWEHFETPHELMRPSYMSKYPPGQGLALALGNLINGMPILGVWITTAAACGCIYWMLLGFVPSTWALVGGVVTVLHPELLQWSQVYWGGSVAIVGSALLLGSCGRLLKEASIISSLMLGLGLVILANSRPFEGLLIAVPVILHLVWKRKFGIATWGWLSLILIPSLVWMGYYNLRITGNMLRMPFVEYSSQYDVYPKFWFLPTHIAPPFLNDSMRLIHTLFERGDYDQLRTFTGFLKISAQRLWILISKVGCPLVLFIPLLGGVGQLRFVVITVGVFVLGLWAENFLLPHYAAPIVPFFILMITVGWRCLRQSGRIGQVMSRAIAIGFVLSTLVNAAAPVNRDSLRQGQQELIQNTTELQTQTHLIFVRYSADHLMHDEWVYNAADLENSRVVWAREMGPAEDAPVIRYFKNRQVWTLTVGKDTLRLDRYEAVR